MADGQFDANAVRTALETIKDPETGRSVVTMDQVSDISVSDGQVSLTLGLTTHSAPLWDDTIADTKQLLESKFPQATNNILEVGAGLLFFCLRLN